MDFGFSSINKTTSVKVAILNLENVLASSIVGIIDIFSITNTFCCCKGRSRYFEVTVIDVDKTAKNFNTAITFPSIQPDKSQTYDLIIVPPIIKLEHNFNISDDLISWIQAMHQKGSYICSVCIGAYILAGAGLLTGKKATTHWAVESKLRSEFPEVDLHIDKIIIEDNNIITSGGVSTYVDLCLYIIRKFISIDAAYKCANYLVVDSGRTSQKPYKDLTIVASHNDTDINRLVEWISTNYTQTFTIKKMARKISLGERTFLRRFKKATGELPNTFIQKVRVQKAKECLVNTNESFESITEMVGYTNTSSFRRLFKTMTGLNPGEYRHSFMVQ